MVKSDYESIDLPSDSFPDLFYKHMVQYANKVALVDGIKRDEITYAELITNVKQLAIVLNKLGLKKGQIVSLYAPNCFQYVYSLFAVMTNGATTSNVNPTYTSYELSNAIKLTRSTWWITTQALKKNLIKILKDNNVAIEMIILIDATNEDTEDGCIPFASLVKSSPSVWSTSTSPLFPAIFFKVHISPMIDPAIILFSSGTTGLPKAVLLTHHNFVAMITLVKHIQGSHDSAHGPNEQPITISILPFFHIYGLVGVLFLSLFSGHKVVILPKFLPDEVFKCIELYKVTVFPLVPSLLNFLVKNEKIKEDYDLKSLRRIFSGAAPLTKQSDLQFRKIYKVAELKQGYGLTESCLATLAITPKRPNKRGSVGHPLPNSEVVIRSLETGKDLGPHQVGEICLKGPQVMLGYLNDKKSTDEAIDKNGWLHTGDIGYYDDEGYFYIKDRIKELVKCKGYQVAPAELESLILTHPSVADCAVIGIPDDNDGEVPKAFVVKKQNCDVTAEEITSLISRNLSYYKHLKGGVEFISEIPKNETGKILRRHLKNMNKSKL